MKTKGLILGWMFIIFGTAFLASTATLYRNGDIDTQAAPKFESITNVITNVSRITNSEYHFPWLEIRRIHGLTGVSYNWLEGINSTNMTNIEIRCAREPVILGQTNGQWIIHFK